MACPALRSLGWSGFPTGRPYCPQGFLPGSLQPRPLAGPGKPGGGDDSPPRLPPSAGPGCGCAVRTRLLQPQPRASPAGGAPERAAERPSVPSRAPETMWLSTRGLGGLATNTGKGTRTSPAKLSAGKEMRLRLGGTHFHFATQLRRSFPGSNPLHAQKRCLHPSRGQPPERLPSADSSLGGQNVRANSS